MNEKQLSDRTSIIGYVMIGIILIAVFGNSFFRQELRPGEQRITLQSEGSLTLHPSAGEPVTVLYASLTACTLLAGPDYGQPTGGTLTDQLMDGTWHSDTLGDYIASVDTGIPCCIILDTENTRYVINIESETATRSLASSLSAIIP